LSGRGVGWPVNSRCLGLEETREERERRQARQKEAWEEEKKEALRYKARREVRTARAEEAHVRRVGGKLKEFWQTSPSLHRYDYAFISCIGAAVGMVVWTWQQIAANNASTTSGTTMNVSVSDRDSTVAESQQAVREQV